MPGADGLDGRLAADAGGGHVDFDTAAAELRLPQLFRGPLPLARLAGRVRFERGEDGALELSSRRLALANADLEARARLHVRTRPGQAPWLDLQAEFAEGDIGAISRYLPAAIMPDDVVAWLDRALQGGRVTDGTMVLRGPGDAFPFRGREGVFDVDVQVSDARVAFAPGWPALDAMRGRVHFAGPALTISADAGRIYDARVSSLRARFDDLERPVLGLRGALEAPMDDVLRALTETPLREHLGEAFRGATGSGMVALELALEIPLGRIEDTDVDGRFRLAGASLAQPRFGLQLAGLRGTGRFTDERLAIEGLGARLRGQPVTIGASTDRRPPRRIRFTLDGRLGAAELVPDLPRAFAARLGGRAPWHAEIDVPIDAGGARLLRIRAHSDLRGVAVDLPAPLGKPAPPARPLRLQLTLDPGGARHVARIRYGDSVRLALGLSGDRGTLAVDRVGLRFGGAAPVLPQAPGIHLAGDLERLALGPWIAFLAAGGEAGGGAALPAFGAADLRIGRATLGAYAATGLHARTQRVDGGVRVALDANELAGHIDLPAGAGAGRALRARLDWIDLALLSPPAEADDRGPAGARPWMRCPPGGCRRSTCAPGRIELADGTVHEAALVTSPSGNELTIHRLQFDNPGLALEGQGAWSSRGGGRTRLRLVLRGDDFGAGLAELGYGELMEAGSGRVTAELEWPGPPWSPRLATLGGHATLDLGDGVIERVDVGPARILGLLSLNVQGVLRSGFPFDEIRGRVDLADGNAYTRGLVIEGPPGRIQVEGRTGLAARDYDQTIRFRPQLSRSLPVIGALSGGPAAGLAVAVIQGLLRNLGADVEKATELTYRLTGSWADPRVRRVNAEPSAQPDAPAGDAGARRP
ncbi:MAG: YhdP family protein [Halofilum sp. (in: g-proteobacteria)]|nr:YhdP family protein [Halofilum sp. (in: g-proteobacteria)]